MHQPTVPKFHNPLLTGSALLFIFTGLAFAQTDEPTARDWFYSAKDMVAKPITPARPRSAHPPPVKPPASPAAGTRLVANSSLGIRYSVLKKDASGAYTEVSPETRFNAGDKIRLHVTSSARGYLYIVQKGSSGNWAALFPSAEINNGQNLIAAGRAYQIPGGHGEDFELDEHAGVEQIFILLTRQPETDLDKIVLSLRGSPSDRTSASGGTALALNRPLIDDRLVAQFRAEVKSRDLIFTKSDDTKAADGRKDEAVYVVNTNPDAKPDPRVVVDVKLTHQ